MCTISVKGSSYYGRSIFLFGIAVGIAIGQQYYKHQIVKRKNKKIIEQIKKWIAEAEK